ncbi:hypothetical protein RJ641_035265 [Dillenia turbinata]|uniref:Protein kinase domain-containing protein n=1 Tax=Dillenia turbinata TaxID=194707 RepID=A0AAN8VIY8_9MAGN
MGIAASSAIKFFKDSGTIKGENREKELTLRNGKLLLEKLKAECDCRSDLFMKHYGGNDSDYNIEKAISDVVMASQVNKHNNMLKFLGCCLETNMPTLVFEFPDKGTLLTHLHHCLPKRILHLELKPSNIFLDGNYVAKLSGFNLYTDQGDVYAFGTLLLEILLEENFQTILETVAKVGGSPPQSPAQVGGSPRRSPPDLSPRSRLFYISDAAPPQTVTANDALSELPWAVPDEDHLWKEVIRAGFMTKKTFGANYQQFMACGELALQCRKFNSHQRPTMMEVALELRSIINFQTSTLRK